MGSREIILFLMVSFQFYSPVSLFPLGKNLPSAHLQENMGNKETEEYSRSTHGGGSEIAHRSNFAYGAGSARGGTGSRPGGNGEEGSGSATPNTIPGTAVIPLYAAGAANRNHNHHRGAGSCNRSCIGLPTLCAVMLASLAVHIYVVLGIEN